MRKIAIVTDSSISFNEDKLKNKDINITPLTIIYDDNEYLDGIDITVDEVNDLISQNKVLSTSLPNIGSLADTYTKLNEEGYETIFALPISQHLSGTHQAFVQAVDVAGVDNVIVVDTYTLVSPIQRMIDTIFEMNRNGENNELILEKLQDMINHNESYVLPLDLKQLKASGRISPAAATMASLLRIKPILKLANKGETIDKFATSRTEKKAFDIIIKDLEASNVKPETHYLDFLHCEGKERLEECKAYIFEKLGTFESRTSILPSSLTVHAGTGTIAVQWLKK